MRRNLLFLLSSATLAGAHAQTAAAPTPAQKVILRSGHVTMCQPGKGCDEVQTGGRHTFTMDSDGYRLKVTSGTDGKHGYSDVVITNQTGSAQQVDPADFRMEETEPHLHRLFYVDPNRQAPVDDKPAKEEKVHDLPPPGYWTSHDRAAEKRASNVVIPSTGAPLLRAGSIAPDATVSGRVYFERPRTASGVIVFLALPGALFEFPAQLPEPAKKKKHGKKTRDDDQTAST